MRFREAFKLGKRRLWLSGRKGEASTQPGHNSGKEKPYGVNPAEGILKKPEEFRKERPERWVSTPGLGKMPFPVAGRRESDYLEIDGLSPSPRMLAVQKLLASFPVRKNAELISYIQDSDFTEREDHDGDQMREVFALTKKTLAKILGPLNWRSIRDPELLEKALGKVHPQLPITFRLILRKKEYIQFMLDHRERLVS